MSELMGNRAKKVHSDATWRRENLREGYTTGACATAATAAAVRALVSGKPVPAVTIDLPARKNVVFQMARCEFLDDMRVRCGVIKDAGDDPDVTHGAEIQATAEWLSTPEIVITGGAGVGKVTKPGLPVPVGEAAINPVPRRMIAAAARAEAGHRLVGRGLKITISVPNGEKIATETYNPRLGILGGISILGTTGIVKPYSVSAYRASIYVEMKVAVANGATHVVFTTGNRSETYARAHYPHLPEMAFLQVGDHLDYALKQARRLKLAQVTISTMVGKLSKMAQGRFQTHVSGGSIDHNFLATVAAEMGAPAEIVAQVRQANTARHTQIILRKAGILTLETELAQRAAENARRFVDGAYAVNVLCFDIRGELLGTGEAHGN